MSRCRGNLVRCIAGIEKLTESKLHREVGPAPPFPDTLEAVTDTLYDLTAEHHERKSKDGAIIGESQLIKDLKELVAMCNGSLSADTWTHYCWDPVLQRPCCSSRADAVEKMTVAVVHAMYGSSDPRPAESRWTHLLQSFKRTLIRRVVHKIGLDCFVETAPVDDGNEATHVTVEDEGSDEYFKHLIRVRTRKVKDYSANDLNMHQLVVYTAILEISDSNLLYPLLGDAIEDTAADMSKLDKLLDRE
eukprot:3888828-Pyramimonas_sp.AAC.1